MNATTVGATERQPVVFGVYRDGDNNLDEVQERNVTDFIKTTAANPALKVVAEDTTRVAHPPFLRGQLRTEWSTIQGGSQHITRIAAPADMSNRRSLAAFVEQTLEARVNDPQFHKADVWIDLVDHGGGDGGGLQADSTGGFMSLEDIAGAIDDGKAAFRKKRPGCDDAVTGVLANQCLMATVGFAEGYYTRPLQRPVPTYRSPSIPNVRCQIQNVRCAIDTREQSRLTKPWKSWRTSGGLQCARSH